MPGSSLAAALAAPVKVKRNAVFPVKNFGSQMAPFYTILPLCFLLGDGAGIVGIRLGAYQIRNLQAAVPLQFGVDSAGAGHQPIKIINCAAGTS